MARSRRTYVTYAPSISDTNLPLYTKDTVWSLEASVGGICVTTGNFPSKATQSNYSKYT